MPIKPTSVHSHSRFASTRMALLCVGALLSCDGNPPLDDATGAVNSALSGSDVDLVRTLRSIEVTPGNPLVVVDLNAKGSRSFKVLARYNDRSTAEVTASATFTLDNSAVGAMTGARFDSTVQTAFKVDFAHVTVRYREGGIEVTAKTTLTVAWTHTSGPTPDLVYSLPYLGATSSQTQGFGTTVQSLDTFLAVDTTGSMAAEIGAVGASFDGTISPNVRTLVKDSWFGVGAVDDFPIDSFGSPGCGGGPDDQPLILISPMTSDLVATKTSLGLLLRGSSPRGCGNDTPEGQMEALYQIATGEGNVVSGVVNIPAHKTKGHGGVEFRDGALPVVTLITDASFHTLGEPTRTCSAVALDYTGKAAMAAHSRSTTTAALKNVCARVLGIAIDTGVEAGCEGIFDLTQMATDTGSLVPPEAWDATGTRPTGCASGQCCTGIGNIGEAPNASGLCPLAMKATSAGTGIGAAIVAGLTQLLHFAAFDVGLTKSGVTTAIDGTALPMGKTTADFLGTMKAIDGTAPTTPGGLKAPTASGDHFTTTIPGSTVRFSVDAKNDFVPATVNPQAFRAKVSTLGNGCATLDQRDVLIIVPPAS